MSLFYNREQKKVATMTLFIMDHHPQPYINVNLKELKVLNLIHDLLEILNNVVNVFVYGVMINGFRSFLWRSICCDRK